ncbi:uncharacterized protein FIESC28_03832 [Fusarium coffeatum]|uniref:Small ribosomal subunit protein mS23 n=1 Tax=Fusarium coffeatum TaxID=231269 RepID=A0A366S3M2_9HYPO|nr:uncharacterized protein FIESC28_03832 [Fusarium coffeatum]RBR23356.1 hypothetical protein FIESC28_03832 [Fusarium coffeatum]
MGGRQIRPARVLQTVTQELNHTILGGKTIPTPPWYNIIQSVPPAETLVRNVTPRLQKGSRKQTKPKKLFRPQTITYVEDTLRSTFYRDHPWELARPRVILESDGKDYHVIQRQLWLMNHDKRDLKEAYDIVRHEFYRLRQEEEIEKRVAQEEAKHVGAYFGQTRIDVAHTLEDREFENWKLWAGKETERMEQSRNSEIEDFGLEDEADAVEDPEEQPEVKAEAAEGKKSP